MNKYKMTGLSMKKHLDLLQTSVEQKKALKLSHSFFAGERNQRERRRAEDKPRQHHDGKSKL